MRRYLVFVLFLIALAGSLSAVAATQHAMQFQLRGYVDATHTADLPYRVPRLGVNADLFQYAPDEIRQHLEWMQQANIHWIRQFAYWDQLEPQSGEYAWDAWDDLVEIMRDFPDLQLVVVFMNSPTWARSNDVDTEPPEDLATFGQFVSRFAARYGEQLDYYQIWDEPNLDDAWGQRDPRPAEYTALLSEAYSAIHNVDGEATVIAAALAPTVETSGANIADILYLQDLYALGASQYFDAAAAKPYGFDLAPDDRTAALDTLNLSRIVALREVMVANGDGKKALWASAWGWNALPDDWKGSPSIWGDVTEEQRNAYTVAALGRAEREWPWLGGMILTHWQPPVEDTDPLWGFSIIDQSSEPASLWHVLADIPEQHFATNGLYHPRTAFASYSGLWTFSDLGADIGWLSDSQLQFNFIGTDVALLLREGDYFAFLYPTVDDQPANLTPQDNQGNSYIVLRSASLEPELNLVPVSRGLHDTTHRLHVIADRGWDQWALAGYAVSSGNLALPYQRQLILAAITAVISLLGVMISALHLPWRTQWLFIGKIVSLLNNTAQTIISIMTSVAMMLGLLLTWGTHSPNVFRRVVLDPLPSILLSGGLIVWQPGFLLTMVALFLLFVLIYNRLENGLLLILVYAPFYLFPVELYRFAFPMVELLVLITTSAWLLHTFAAWGRIRQSGSRINLKLNLHPIDWLLLAWVTLGGMAILWSADHSVALTDFRTIFLEPGLFYLIIRIALRSQEGYIRLAKWFVFAGILVAGISLTQYIFGASIITAENDVPRLAGIYGSPNNLALYLERVLPFTIAFFFIPLATDRWVRWVAFVAALVITASILLTQSVGGILLGVPAGIAATLLVIFRKRALLPLSGLAFVAVILVVILLQVSPRFASLLDWSTGTNFMRLRVWESSLEMIIEQPLTGLGLDQFLYAYRSEMIRPDAIADPDLSHPHQIVLDFWLRLGVMGIFLLFTWFTYTVQYAQHLQRNLHTPESRLLAASVIGGLASLVVHGLIDNSIYVIDLAYVFIFFQAILTQLGHEAAQPEQPVNISSDTKDEK